VRAYVLFHGKQHGCELAYPPSAAFWSTSCEPPPATRFHATWPPSNARALGRLIRDEWHHRSEAVPARRVRQRGRCARTRPSSPAGHR